MEIPLKAIGGGCNFAILPISGRSRKHGVARLKLKEMGSRYFLIRAYLRLEKNLSRGNYRRRNESAGSAPHNRPETPPDRRN